MITPSESVRPLSESAYLQKQSAELVRAKTLLYGRQLLDVAIPSGVLIVKFEDVSSRQVDLTLRVRCAGFEYEIQIVDVSIFLDLSATLDAHVPSDLQHAGFMHLFQPFFEAFEKIFQTPVSLISIQGASVAKSKNEALGILISSHDKSGGKSRSSAGYLHVKTFDDWREFSRRAQKWVSISPSKFDIPIELSVEFKPVPISLSELKSIELGDVLILETPAKDHYHESLQLRHGVDYLQGILVKRIDKGIQIIAIETPFNALGRDFQTTHRNYSMNSDPISPLSDADKNLGNDLEKLQVSIECELSRISLPLSALQALSVGQVLNTDKLIDDESVVLKCYGQIIGAGHLIAIGDHLGVRITALTLGRQKHHIALADKILNQSKTTELAISVDGQD